jgi:tetratricopeptide (TPR) repeat protein
MGDDWESRVAQVWAAASQLTEAHVVELIDALAAERPGDDALALFECASARDYVGDEAGAEPLYRAALARELPEPARGRAVIQLASTLRTLGRPIEAIAILQEGFSHDPDHRLADPARAFLALCLSDAGDHRAAVAVAVDALAPHLHEYSRSVRAYAAEMIALE